MQRRGQPGLPHGVRGAPRPLVGEEGRRREGRGPDDLLRDEDAAAREPRPQVTRGVDRVVGEDQEPALQGHEPLDELGRLPGMACSSWTRTPSMSVSQHSTGLRSLMASVLQSSGSGPGGQSVTGAPGVGPDQEPARIGGGRGEGDLAGEGGRRWRRTPGRSSPRWRRS